MKDHLLENRNIQKLFTLLAVCSENPKPVTAILAETLSSTEEYRFWRNLKDYAIIGKNALEIHDRLVRLGLNNPGRLSVSQVYAAFHELKELRKLIERSEKSIIDGKFDQLDVVHIYWRSYLLNILRRRLLDKILNTDPAKLIKIKELGSPLYGDISDIVHFLDRLASIKEPFPSSGNVSRDYKNITNFNIANCFRIFTADINTKIPQRVFDFDVFDPPFQNIARNMPKGFFCISRKEYDVFVENMGQRGA